MLRLSKYLGLKKGRAQQNVAPGTDIDTPVSGESNGGATNRAVTNGAVTNGTSIRGPLVNQNAGGIPETNVDVSVERLDVPFSIACNLTVRVGSSLVPAQQGRKPSLLPLKLALWSDPESRSDSDTVIG